MTRNRIAEGKGETKISTEGQIHLNVVEIPEREDFTEMKLQ
jgi:hypothetical protein